MARKLPGISWFFHRIQCDFPTALSLFWLFSSRSDGSSLGQFNIVSNAMRQPIASFSAENQFSPAPPIRAARRGSKHPESQSAGQQRVFHLVGDRVPLCAPAGCRRPRHAIRQSSRSRFYALGICRCRRRPPPAGDSPDARRDFVRRGDVQHRGQGRAKQPHAVECDDAQAINAAQSSAVS